jgi:hypothetical protein
MTKECALANGAVPAVAKLIKNSSRSFSGFGGDPARMLDNEEINLNLCRVRGAPPNSTM